MMRAFVGCIAVLCLSLGGCKPIPTEARMDEAIKSFQAKQRQILEKQASFDLDCPVKELAWFQLGDDAWGVHGCSKKVRYALQCQQRWQRGRQVLDRCRWIGDSSVETVVRPAEREHRRAPSERL